MDANYGISMNSILRMEILQDAKLLAGTSGTDQIVTSVNVMVDPNVVNLVSGGELLVSTAYAVRENLPQLLELIPQLKQRGVVALGLKFNSYINEIPQEILTLCDTLSFPLFEIPNRISFSQLITPIMTTIVNNQAQMLGDIYELQKALTATMLSGGGLQSIVQTLFDRFGNSIAIYNDFFSSFVLACSDRRRESITRRMEDLVHIGSSGRETDSLMSSREVDNVDGLICNKIIIPIYSDKKKYGSIYIWEDNREITNVDLAVLEASTSLIALDMIKKISMYEMENNHKASFLDDLLVHDEERQRKSLANAEYFDFDVDAEHRVAVIRVLSGNSTIGNSSLYKTNNSIVNILRRVSRDSSIKVLFVNKCDSIVLVFELPVHEDGNYLQHLHSFVDSAMNALEAEGILSMVSIGMGRSYADATNLWKSFNEAGRAAACWNIDDVRIHSYEDLGVYRFLSYEVLRPELVLFYNETLKVLVDYDHDRDSELVHTLSLYFRCGGNLKRLAEEMGVHYNTVAYRIQRIKELAHVSFDNADQMLNLQIALKIYEANFHR
ncbi:MAG: PucR family transcriptional regulator ligand-binding domain-containing protein [Angelakisella sp.]|nr:PucR family transcriptional regulator ligand-binding domain-containing protein [Angelakisella sp.]